jgi:NAD(P)-dependent dehydrogenase (short-subunit alcohol dehydrogenase family)
MKSQKVQELFDLTGRVAFLTGAARNLGYDMATALAQCGADIALTDMDFETTKKSAVEIAKETGRKVIAYELNVTNEEDVIKVVDAILKDFGKIDILVNNAGNVVSDTETAQIQDRPYKAWLHTINVNLNGVFLCSKYVLKKAMIPAKSGNIINMGSISGMIGRNRNVYDDSPTMGGTTVDYAAAKGGVINMTRDMAVYLAQYNIRVNSISPGGFERGQPAPFIKAYSEQTPMGRMGKDGLDLKGAAVYLASDASAYCTGHNLVVDGGFIAW